jgi:putative colanic acid biosynthesis UDP-glucose lipid carrier transferase
MHNRARNILHVTIIFGTLIIINSFSIAILQLWGSNLFLLDTNFYLKNWQILNCWWFLFIVINKVYVKKKSVSYNFFLISKFKIYVNYVVFTILYLFVFFDIKLLRFLMISTILCYGVNMLLTYIFDHYFNNSAASKQPAVKKVLILGFNKVSQKLAIYFEQEQVSYSLVGFAEDYENVNQLSHYPIVSDIRNAIEMSKKLHVTEIYLTISPEFNNELYQLIGQAESECIRVIVVPDLSAIIKQPVHVRYFGDIPILLLRSEPLEYIGNRFVKRIFDIMVSTFAIIAILSWLVPLIGLIIYIESRGPVFFRQLRTGRNKKEFFCIKFRSMQMNEEANLIQATKKDNRITRVGRVLRKTSLDEFPQFFNVFAGDMSLVGPRPHMLKHTQDYSQVANQFMIRQFLKPGITGWAQVNGYRGEITTKEQLDKRLEHDIWYLENWNLLLDIKIVFRTIYNSIRGEENAY